MPRLACTALSSLVLVTIRRPVICTAARVSATTSAHGDGPCAAGTKSGRSRRGIDFVGDVCATGLQAKIYGKICSAGKAVRECYGTGYPAAIESPPFVQGSVCSKDIAAVRVTYSRGGCGT